MTALSLNTGTIAAAGFTHRCEQRASGVHTRRSCSAGQPLLEVLEAKKHVVGVDFVREPCRCRGESGIDIGEPLLVRMRAAQPPEAI